VNLQNLTYLEIPGAGSGCDLNPNFSFLKELKNLETLLASEEQLSTNCKNDLEEFLSSRGVYVVTI